MLMILNKVGYCSPHHRLAFIVLMSLCLGACSALPSLPNILSDDKAASKATQTPVSQAADDSAPKLTVNQGGSHTADHIQTGLISQNMLAPLSDSQLRQVQQAMQALSAGQTEQALQSVQALLNSAEFKAAPHTQVWVLRGDIYAAKGEDALAIQDYKQAIEVHKNNPKAHNRLGLLYRKSAQFTLARTHYRQAIEANPHDPAAYRNRAILLDVYVGDKLAALLDYKQYQRLLEVQLKGATAPSKALQKQHKQVQQWIVDVQRQVPPPLPSATLNEASSNG